MIEQVLIFTNNSKVKAKYPEVTEYIEGELLDVLIRVRDEVHLGRKLLSHPLSGSVKPNETFYKSVIMKKEVNRLDLESLAIIEQAIVMARKMKSEPIHRHSDENLREDFMMIDLSLIESAL